MALAMIVFLSFIAFEKKKKKREYIKKKYIYSIIQEVPWNGNILDSTSSGTIAADAFGFLQKRSRLLRQL